MICPNANNNAGILSLVMQLFLPSLWQQMGQATDPEFQQITVDGSHQH